MNCLTTKFIQLTVISGLVLGAFSTQVTAADDKDFSGRIGVINSERIFKDSNLAKASQTKLQSEFAKREKELRDEAQKIKTAAERLDKDAAVMSDTSSPEGTEVPASTSGKSPSPSSISGRTATTFLGFLATTAADVAGGMLIISSWLLGSTVNLKIGIESTSKSLALPMLPK